MLPCSNSHWIERRHFSYDRNPRDMLSQNNLWAQQSSAFSVDQSFLPRMTHQGHILETTERDASITSINLKVSAFLNIFKKEESFFEIFSIKSTNLIGLNISSCYKQFIWNNQTTTNQLNDYSFLPIFKLKIFHIHHPLIYPLSPIITHHHPNQIWYKQKLLK